MFSSFWFLLGAYLMGVVLSMFGFGFISDNPEEWDDNFSKELWTIVGLCFAWPALIVLGSVYWVVTKVVTGFQCFCAATFRAGAWCRQKTEKGFWVMHRHNLSRE